MIKSNYPIVCNEGKLQVKWEDTYIEIPLNFKNTNEAILYKVVRGMEIQIKKLISEVEILRKEQAEYIRYGFDKIEDKIATQKIIKYLSELKKTESKITLFEISQKLKIPADQVERVIEKLEEEEKVKWVEI